jgi:NAD(P)-dependent dehydrogenase (short-subunit alcohol dehydrogenase family)
MTGDEFPRTFLITAASGIGAETARMLVRSATCPKSLQIFLVALDEDECRKLAEELVSLGAVVQYRAGDLTDPDFAPEIVAGCASSFGRIDALFSVAGTSGRRFGDGPVHQCTEEGWGMTLNANVTTQYRMCREVVRLMLAQSIAANGQRGVILNMASILGIDPEPRYFDTAAYAASKGAIIAMSRSMAASYAKQKIRVNAIAPALVRTAMSTRASDNQEILEFMKTKQPLVENMIPVEDVAAACVYLLTDSSRAITGQVLVVDAGWSLG